MRNTDETSWNIYTSVLLFTGIFLTVSKENIGVSYLLQDAADNNGALCLDGTAPRYYINANVTETRKFVMHLQGGGWCAGLYASVAPNTKINSCFDRREEDRGSTRNDNPTFNFNKIGTLNNNKTINPLFYSWVKIFVRYCDGASFRGNRQNPIFHAHNTSKRIYFRGKRILAAVMDHLWSNFGLSQATDFVFSGGSAGGLAVYLNANDIASRFASTKVVALPVSGYFIDDNGFDTHHTTNYSNAMKWICLHQNVSVSSSECMFAQYIANTITIPIFVVNSRYDRWQMDNIMFGGEHYASMHWDLVNDFGDNFIAIITQNYLNDAHTKNHSYGAFISSCYYHNGHAAEYWSGMQIDNYTAAYAFKQFYESIEDKSSRYLWFDGVSSNSTRYPCNTCCPQYFARSICVYSTTFDGDQYETYTLQFRGYFADFPFYSANDSRLYIVGDNKLLLVGELFGDDNISWFCDPLRVSECHEIDYEENIASIDIWECELNSKPEVTTLYTTNATVTTSSTTNVTVTTSYTTNATVDITSTESNKSIFINIVIYVAIVVVCISCLAIIIIFRLRKDKTNNFTRIVDDEFDEDMFDDQATVQLATVPLVLE